MTIKKKNWNETKPFESPLKIIFLFWKNEVLAKNFFYACFWKTLFVVMQWTEENRFVYLKCVQTVTEGICTMSLAFARIAE